MSKTVLNNGDKGSVIRAALNSMFSELYTGRAFRRTVTIHAASAATLVEILEATSLSSGERVYITDILLSVDGATAWTDAIATKIVLQDDATVPVEAMTIAKSALIGNALLSKMSSGVTLASALKSGVGMTAGKGLYCAADGNFSAGSDIVLTVLGMIG